MQFLIFLNNILGLHNKVAVLMFRMWFHPIKALIIFWRLSRGHWTAGLGLFMLLVIILKSLLHLLFWFLLLCFWLLFFLFVVWLFVIFIQWIVRPQLPVFSYDGLFGIGSLCGFWHVLLIELKLLSLDREICQFIFICIVVLWTGSFIKMKLP